MDTPMTSAERVRLSRWVNKVEEVADSLLDLLKSAPDPLPRVPVIDPELVDRLARFTLNSDDESSGDFENIRFLQLGNGHQSSNKARALECVVRMLGARRVDGRTIDFGKWGV